MNKISIVILVITVALAGLGLWLFWNNLEQNKQNLPIASAFYMCNDQKTIQSDYYKGAQIQVEPGQMPQPTGSVKLVLSDGRNLQLSQTISADGSRYANSDESIVFWSKGNGAFILENNQQQTYIGCLVVVPDPGNLPQVFESGEEGFSIRYPAGYTVNPDYVDTQFGPGKEIGGVSFTIPESLTTGTNLATDTYISVEEIPQSQQCSASMFLPDSVTSQNQTDNGVAYSVASFTGAAAGNRYDETVYALPDTNPCIAVRYLIHYGVIENYPAGTVQEFDKQALLNQFDSIRRTLVIQ